MTRLFRNFLPARLAARWHQYRGQNWEQQVESGTEAKKFVTELMDDQELYQAMSKKEGEVWSKVFTDDARKEAVAVDQQAGYDLGLNRHKFGLPMALAKHDFHPKRGLSLACGGGRAERTLMQRGICQSFHAIDIAAGALADARKLAAEHKMNITYEQADLNELALAANSYDLVVTQNCLHHVLRLEELAAQIHQSLRPGGLLWINDYIGETQFQYDDERLAIVNRILAILPEKYRHNLVNKQLVDKVVRRPPGSLISPFEAIRSADIMPVFLERFEVIDKHESASILDLVCPVGTRASYAADDEGRLVFELLFMLDELFIETQLLSARAGVFLLRAK